MISCIAVRPHLLILLGIVRFHVLSCERAGWRQGLKVALEVQQGVQMLLGESDGFPPALKVCRFSHDLPFEVGSASRGRREG